MREVDDYQVSHKRLCGISRKLSLESTELGQKRNDAKGADKVPSNHLHQRQMEHKGLKQESKEMPSEHNQIHEDLQATTNKPLCDPSVIFEVKNDEDVFDLASNQCSSTSKPQILMDSLKSLPLVQSGFNSLQKPNQGGDGRPKCNIIDTKLEKEEVLESLDSNRETVDYDTKLLSAAKQSSTQFQSSGSQRNISLPQAISHNGREPHSGIVDGDGNSFTRIKHKKLGLAGRTFSLSKSGPCQCLQKDNTENLAPNSSFPLAHSSKNPLPSSSLSMISEVCHSNESSAQNYSTHFSGNSSRTIQRQPLKPPGQFSNRSNVTTQCELQSLNPSKIYSEKHDCWFDEEQRSKQYCREKVVEIKKPEGTSPSCDSDAVIVLDSEDSDGEQGRAARSKSSLVRRRMPGKLKF